jgi:hypothetical protein
MRANADVASGGRPFDQGLDVVLWRDLVDRRKDPPQLSVAPLESAASRLWLSASRASSSSPTTWIGLDRSPLDLAVDGGHDGSKRRQEFRSPARRPRTIAEGQQDRKGEEQDCANVWSAPMAGRG